MKTETIIISRSEELRNFDFSLKKREKRRFVLVLLGDLTGQLGINYNLASHSSAEIYLATLLSGKSNLTMNYTSSHTGDYSKSSLKSVGVLDDFAHKKTTMKIVFNEGAKNAEGSESENVTLLSENARNISSPIIESHEESAHGVHSASTGHLDEDQVRFLRARGLKTSRARSLLVYSGLLNFFDVIKDRDIVEYILRKVNNETR